MPNFSVRRHLAGVNAVIAEMEAEMRSMEAMKAELLLDGHLTDIHQRTLDATRDTLRSFGVLRDVIVESLSDTKLARLPGTDK